MAEKGVNIHSMIYEGEGRMRPGPSAQKVNSESQESFRDYLRSTSDRSMEYHDRHERAFTSLMKHVQILMEEERIGVPAMEGLLDLAKQSVREEVNKKGKL